MTRSTISLVILHILGNALLLWLGYYWLGTSESDGIHLLWSAVVVVLLICSVVWLHGTALALFHRESRLSLVSAARKTARNLTPLLVLAIIALGVYWSLTYLYRSFGHTSFVIGSYLTLHFRHPVAPERVLACFRSLILLCEWLIAPVLLLPVAASVARLGWKGFGWLPLRRSKNFVYSLEVCALLLLAIWAPLRLLHWVPVFESFSVQVLSFAARLGVGYSLLVIGLLSLEFLTSAGKPRVTQPSTNFSP